MENQKANRNTLTSATVTVSIQTKFTGTGVELSCKNWITAANIKIDARKSANEICRICDI